VSVMNKLRYMREGECECGTRGEAVEHMLEGFHQASSAIHFIAVEHTSQGVDQASSEVHFIAKSLPRV
jgi:hypothetical protein